VWVPGPKRCERLIIQELELGKLIEVGEGVDQGNTRDASVCRYVRILTQLYSAKRSMYRSQGSLRKSWGHWRRKRKKQSEDHASRGSRGTQSRGKKRLGKALANTLPRKRKLQKRGGPKVVIPLREQEGEGLRIVAKLRFWGETSISGPTTSKTRKMLLSYG